MPKVWVSNKVGLMPRTESPSGLVHAIRGEKVLLDGDLAELHGVTASALNQAVKRSHTRFPDDFKFQLMRGKAQAALQPRSPSVTLKPDQNINYLPYAFAEQGVAILSSVLRSKRVVEVNIAIARIFVHWRRLMHSNRSWARKTEIIEKRHHEQFAIVLDAIKELIAQDQTRKAQLKRHMAGY